MTAVTNANIQSVISSLTPSEQTDFASMLQQILPQLSGLAQSHDGYTPPASGGSSPIASEYAALSPSAQSDFDNFCSAVITAMESPAATSSGSAAATASTNGAAGASGTPLQQMQYWQQQYQSDWANPPTQAQAAQDWQNYLAAAAAWQQGSGGGSVATPGPMPVGPASSGPASSGSVSPGPGITGPNSASPVTASPATLAPGTQGPTGNWTPPTGAIGQPTSSVWTQAGVASAESNSLSGYANSSSWASFDAMWASASTAMNAFDTPQEIGYIKEGITEEAQKTGVDPRIILAQIMQESSGNVNVKTTVSPDGTVSNPGLMQSHNGHTFDPSNPEQSIKQMIADGVEGTWGMPNGGPGLADCIQTAGTVWGGLRMYNSGSVDYSNLASAYGATGGYVNEMMLKLTTMNWSAS